MPVLGAKVIEPVVQRREGEPEQEHDQDEREELQLRSKPRVHVAGRVHAFCLAECVPDCKGLGVLTRIAMLQLCYDAILQFRYNFVRV